MAACPDKQTLAAFAEGKLSEERAAVAEGHIERCRRCAERLARLPIGEDLVERIRDLEESRARIDSALTGLREVEKRITTTLFGGGSG